MTPYFERYNFFKRCPCERCDKEAQEVLEEYEKSLKINKILENAINNNKDDENETR